MPFDKETCIPMRIDKVEHQTMTKDDAEIGLVKMTFLVSPLTRELADDLSAFMRRTLFTATDAEVNPQLKAAQFDLGVKPQLIEVRSAPDQDDPTFTIEEAKIGTLVASRSKKAAGWRLRFSATFSPRSEHQLAQVVDSYTKTRYCTFENAVADLFSESKQTERKARRQAAQAEAAAVGATAH